jgi:AcrR family transcriptional regulator
MEKAIPAAGRGEGRDDVATRIARQTLAARHAGYVEEVRRLLDAALEVMQQCGTTSRPRVADIVAAAGLSNETFYRHFPSKDALVTAILDDGQQRLSSYLSHQMAKEPAAQGQVRRWVEGVLSQAVGEVAATTLAVLWNGASVADGPASGHHFASAPLAILLHRPFAELGSVDPPLDASLAAHAVLGILSDHLWRRTEPTPAEIEAVAACCLRIAGGGRGRSSPTSEPPPAPKPSCAGARGGQPTVPPPRRPRVVPRER